MKITFTSIALFVVTYFNAQISIENTYVLNNSGNNSLNPYGSVSIIQFSVSGYKYIVNEYQTNYVKLYNMDHSLWKTISWPSIDGFYSGASSFSENLFDLDNQIEFIVGYSSTTTPIQYNMKILDESGMVIKDIPNRQAMGVFYSGPNGYKLIVSDGDTIRDVYSLPGTSSNLGVTNNYSNEITGLSFPNPTSQIITIPYNLLNGQSAKLNVYDLGGNLVQSFDIDSNFKDFLLDVSSYEGGIYRYNIVLNGVESESKNFVKY